MIKVDWGTDQKCDICGSRKDLWYEPSRFHYYSCEEHKDIAPAYRYEEITKRMHKEAKDILKNKNRKRFN